MYGGKEISLITNEQLTKYDPDHTSSGVLQINLL